MTNLKLDVLTPQNCQIVSIDQQPHGGFRRAIDGPAGVEELNVVGLAKAAKVFNIPTTITTVETESFSGYTCRNCWMCFPDKGAGTHAHELDGTTRRSVMPWRPTSARRSWSPACGRKCAATPFALCAMAEGGYEIYAGWPTPPAVPRRAHDYTMQRMIQAGVVPVTWQQVLLEWQRDWARRDTYDGVMEIVRRIPAHTAWVWITLHIGAQGRAAGAAPHEARQAVPAR